MREGKSIPPDAGFSFIETAVVLLVVAVVAGAMGFAALAGTRQGLDLAADMVAADVRSVREMNRSRDGRVYVVQFDRWNQRYLVKEGLRVLKIGSLPPGVGLVWTNFPYDQLGFNNEGMPVPRGGTLALCDRNGRYLYVVVTSVTGRVRVATVPPPGGSE
ncbi:MAG: GspH/FimT family protein [Desulfotomaculales bacterium]